MSTNAKDLGGIVHVVDDNGDPQYYYSILAHEELFDHGLITQAIAGKFHVQDELNEDTLMDGSNFSQNPAYIEVIHKTISENGPQQKSLIAEAKRQKDGVVVVIDKRVKDPGSGVPPEDIVGLFKVENSILLEYQANPNYLLWTEKGFSDIGPELTAILVNEIRKLYK